MNIFELTIFILFIASGYFSGKFLGCYYGILGWVIGFLVGGSLFALIYYLIMHFWNTWFPIHPPCKNGKCFSDDYKIVEYNKKGGSFILCCKCGMKYFQKLPYFKEILSDGTIKPYMKKNKGRWEIDNGDK